MHHKVETNVDISHFNTFGVKAFSKHYLAIDNELLIESFNEMDLLKTENRLVLGGGSNVLFTKDYDGIILHNQIKGMELVSENASHYYVNVKGGENWHEFVLFCIQNNYAGAENLSLIPGSVGASPIQNIGAYGVEMKSIFHCLNAYHFPTGEIHQFTLLDCEFGYRDSVFKSKYKGEYLILDITFQLNKTPDFNTSYGAIEQQLEAMKISSPTIKDVSDAVIAIRQSKLPDPKVLGNTGSFFKNPVVNSNTLEAIQSSYPEVPNYPAPNNQVKIAAGWLIEQAGWKGYKRNNHGVHTKQALVLVNYGGATGQEIFQLSQDIIDSVNEKFGIELEREVNVL